MLSIENATAGDVPLIRNLAMQVWPQTYLPILGEQQLAYMLDLFYNPQELERQIGEPDTSFVVVYSDEKPVAFASVSKTGAAKYKLHKLYIVPGQQGKGVGKFIIGYLTNTLKAKGATDLTLNVNRYNYSAIAFYQKIGFNKERDEDIDIGNGYFMNDHVLKLPL